MDKKHSQDRKLALTLGGDVNRFFKLSEADAAAYKIPDGYDAQLGDKVKALVKKVEATPPTSPNNDEKLEKSIDLERVLVEDSMHILLNYDSGVNDIEYMLKLVEVNG